MIQNGKFLQQAASDHQVVSISQLHYVSYISLPSQKDTQRPHPIKSLFTLLPFDKTKINICYH